MSLRVGSRIRAMLSDWMTRMPLVGGRRPAPASPRQAAGAGCGNLLDPSEIVFLICVEANRLEPQALLLCGSIRAFGGRYRNAPIVAVSPRPRLALSSASQARLEALDVTYVALPLNETGSPYGTINRIVAGAWAETRLAQPFLVLLDTDTLFVDEPEFVRADIGVRPVDVKGSAICGADDPLDAYWSRLCAIADIELGRLPCLRTTVDQLEIRASYNGGFTVVRRELGVLQRTRDIFFASLAEDLRPLEGQGLDIKSSTGEVGRETSEWWGSSQATLSTAIWSSTDDVHVYDARYNIPAHSLADPDLPWPLPEGAGPVLVHYHYLAEPPYQPHLRSVLRRLGCSTEVREWVDAHLPLFEPGEVSLHSRTGTVAFCTLAIHEPYRRRARLLCGDLPHVPWVVLTDDPSAFSDLPVRAIAHAPTGPMAIDYLERLAPTGNHRGAAAYHDKRFALRHTLERHDTAIFLDADSRIDSLPPMGPFPPGLSVLPLVRRSIAEHLQSNGPWRLPAFLELAEHLTGSTDILWRAPWCHEACIAVTKDGREGAFFDTWGRAAAFMQERDVFSGEGGVIGLAADLAGWAVDFEAVVPLGRAVQHEGEGPKPG